jgi:hypothetical protein
MAAVLGALLLHVAALLLQQHVNFRRRFDTCMERMDPVMLAQLAAACMSCLRCPELLGISCYSARAELAAIHSFTGRCPSVMIVKTVTSHIRCPVPAEGFETIAEVHPGEQL